MAGTAVLDTENRVLAGIALTSAAYMLFSTQDAMIKLLVTGYAVWQILFFRGLVVLAGCALVGGRGLLREAARSPIMVPMFFRSFLILGAWLCYYSAARDLQLAELTTIYFAAPVIVVILSILLLNEKVSPLRWAAVLVGFAGVFIACDPARLGFSLPATLVLVAAALWALSSVLLRRIAMQEKTSVQLVLNNAFFILIAGVPMFWIWQTPNVEDLALLVAMGAVGGIGQYALFAGFRRAPMSVIAPFEYTSLVWAFLLGFMIWSDVPRREVFLGAGLIVAAGLLIIASERRNGRVS